MVDCHWILEAGWRWPRPPRFVVVPEKLAYFLDIRSFWSGTCPAIPSRRLKSICRLIDEALAGEPVTITRDGRPVAEPRASAPVAEPKPMAHADIYRLRARRDERPGDAG
jgi:antitoxin (DNA-binding transcriptional repressor) of toxin-antitoxin stability system